jgi:hypothetical protein
MSLEVYKIPDAALTILLASKIPRWKVACALPESAWNIFSQRLQKILAKPQGLGLESPSLGD